MTSLDESHVLVNQIHQSTTKKHTRTHNTSFVTFFGQKKKKFQSKWCQALNEYFKKIQQNESGVSYFYKFNFVNM